MAFKETLVKRVFNISKSSTQALRNCRISSPSSSVRTLIPPTKAPNPGHDGILRRLLQRRAIFQAAMRAPEALSLPVGEKLIEKLRGMDIARERLRLEGLRPPEMKSEAVEGLSAEDARKLLRLAQLERVKSMLREVRKSWIPYSEYVEICVEGCSDPGQGPRFAKMLDESGTVIVLGNIVLLRPEQVAKAIQGLIPMPVSFQNDERKEELEGMERQKVVIDKEAESLVRRELWCGLGFFMVQTLGFMRLTFWELSWDVMEPICFFVTSIYFMAGYSFFLKTSKEPSFEGFFQSRFLAKQKRLMKSKNFDVGRYNELRKACQSYSSSSEQASSTTSLLYDSERMPLGSLHH
ncbi:calcium uniporter protein 2, mitochondrial [Vitis riparia]|uniref:calcium uniporter protein 2, mitochondrial n=1 Tax=Vitis riparia TaxID=96939 RepID=UPI00155AB61D|nr:calcium uniporter protein 2, mitochondrial [Vitis riparia]